MPKSKKKIHTHKTIFTWFSNFPTSTKLQGFHYYQGKIQSAAIVFFFSLSRNTTTTNPNLKIAFSTSCALAWADTFHGLSLRKSHIKNHATLFRSSWLIKPDQTKLGSTKPNKSLTWRLVQSPTSTAILQNTIPHPCNSSSCRSEERRVGKECSS